MRSPQERVVNKLQEGDEKEDVKTDVISASNMACWHLATEGVGIWEDWEDGCRDRVGGGCRGCGHTTRPTGAQIVETSTATGSGAHVPHTACAVPVAGTNELIAGQQQEECVRVQWACEKPEERAKVQPTFRPSASFEVTVG